MSYENRLPSEQWRSPGMFAAEITSVNFKIQGHWLPKITPRHYFLPPNPAFLPIWKLHLYLPFARFLSIDSLLFLATLPVEFSKPCLLSDLGDPKLTSCGSALTTWKKGCNFSFCAWWIWLFKTSSLSKTQEILQKLRRCVCIETKIRPRHHLGVSVLWFLKK